MLRLVTWLQRKIVDQFVVQGPHENAERLVQMCAKMDPKVEYTYFKKEDVHKHTWVSEVNGKKTLRLCAHQQDIQG